jgi:hypothetical protein
MQPGCVRIRHWLVVVAGSWVYLVSARSPKQVTFTILK